MIPKQILKDMEKYPAFQQQVWKICATIPKGETRTYSWIAKQLGSPRAARAVGSALGKNPFAPIIPCHRVIRSDGKLGGYSGEGGLATKQRMLREEAAQ